MANRGDVHVVYHQADKGWRVEVAGNKRALGKHATKPPASRPGSQARAAEQVRAGDPQAGRQDRRPALLRQRSVPAARLDAAEGLRSQGGQSNDDSEK